MSNRPKVSALVPAYQSAGFIQETLDSLSLQTQDGFSVIISVDLCDDETYEVCLQHCSKDSRFSVVKQDKRLGYVGNCNALLDMANSDYVLFAFHDDILDASYVERLCAILDSEPDVVMSFSDVLLTTVEGETRYWKYQKLDGVEKKFTRGLAMLSRKGHWWVPNRGVFRLEEARTIQGLKTHAYGEFSTDWPWLFHMSLLGQFKSIPEVLCYKFYKKESITRGWGFSLKQWHSVTFACLREVLTSSISMWDKVRLAGYLAYKLIKLQVEIQTGSFISCFKSRKES